MFISCCFFGLKMCALSVSASQTAFPMIIKIHNSKKHSEKVTAVQKVVLHYRNLAPRSLHLVSCASTIPDVPNPSQSHINNGEPGSASTAFFNFQFSAAAF